MSRLTRGIVPASLISFLIVGGSGVFIHLAVLYAVLSATGQFALSQTAAALAAVTSNFLLNNRLTFRDKRLRGTRLVTGYIKFLVISSIGIAANVSIATLTYQEVGQIALLAAFAGIALDTLWKFVVIQPLRLELAPLDAALVAIVAGRAHVEIGDVGRVPAVLGARAQIRCVGTTAPVP